VKVIIAEYSPTWPALFEQDKKLLKAALGENENIIEHVGSTSVVGLAAKPVIDIMIGLRDFSVADDVVPKIEVLGYEYISNYEDVMPFRRYLKKVAREKDTHHIHMVEIGGEFWERHLLFRDYLRENHEAMDEYANLKEKLGEEDWENTNQYADAKTVFIRSIEKKAKERT
jgi:GrpB-like predicted nucleotidyltransferase (UPF0157 family)